MYGEAIKEETTTTGTGDLTVAGAVDSDHNAISDFFAINERFCCGILDETNNEREYGIYYLSASTTVVRETVIRNSSGTASPLSLGAGTKTVIATPLETSLWLSPDTVNDTATQYVFSLGMSERGTLSLTASRVYYIPFISIYGGWVTGLALDVTTAQAASTARLGIYSLGGGRPAVKLAETGALDTTTTGVKEGSFSSDIVISPGLHCVALIGDSAIGVRTYAGDSINPGFVGHDSGSFLTLKSVVVEAGSGIVLPASPSATPSQRTDNMPIIALVKP